jgi:hypothetical protein
VERAIADSNILNPAVPALSFARLDLQKLGFGVLMMMMADDPPSSDAFLDLSANSRTA